MDRCLYLLNKKVGEHVRNPREDRQYPRPQTMDHYPEVNVSERECSSSRNSTTSSIVASSKPGDQSSAQPTRLHATSFPSPPSNGSDQQRTRNDSVHSDSSIHQDSKSQDSQQASRVVEAEFARYLDAPPPYSEQAYEGKTESERAQMKMVDYARTISRMMGRQLVRGLRRKEEGDK